jgi:hypothetical protein
MRKAQVAVAEVQEVQVLTAQVQTASICWVVMVVLEKQLPLQGLLYIMQVVVAELQLTLLVELRLLVPAVMVVVVLVVYQILVLQTFTG